MVHVLEIGKVKAEAEMTPGQAKAALLIELGFKRCVHPDGCACAGAGTITADEMKSLSTVRCGNQGGKQVTPAETKSCVRRTHHRH